MSTLGSVGSLVATVTADISEFVSGMNQAVGVGQKAGKEIAAGLQGPIAQGVQEIQKSLSELGISLIATGAAVAALVAPLAALGKAAIETAGQFEQNTVAFTFWLGSVTKAKAYLEELYDFAQTTPFQIPTIVSSAQKFMAMGFAAKSVIPDLRIIGDQLAAVGKMGNMERVVYAFGEMKQNAGALGVQLRMLINDAAIPAKKYLEEFYQVSGKGLAKMMRDGAITGSEAVEVILKRMAEKTGGMMAAQMKTMVGQLTNLQDQWTRTKAAIGETLLPDLKFAIAQLTKMTAVVRKMAEGFMTLPEPVRVFAEALGVLSIAAAGLLATVGVAFLLFGSLNVPIALVTGVIIIATAAMAAQVSYIRSNWFPIVSALRVAWSPVASAWEAAWIVMKAIVVSAMNTIHSQVQTALAVLHVFWDVLTKIADKVSTFLPGLGGVKTYFSDIKDAFLFAKAQEDIAAATKKRTQAEADARNEKGKGLGDPEGQRFEDPAKAQKGKTEKAFDKFQQMRAFDPKILEYARYLENMATKTQIADDLMSAFNHTVETGFMGGAFVRPINLTNAALEQSLKDFAELAKQAHYASDSISGSLLDAYDRLGVKSALVLKRQAEDAQNAYLMILRSGAGVEQLRNAWLSMERTRQESVEEGGGKVSVSEKLKLQIEELKKSMSNGGGLLGDLGRNSFEALTQGFHNAVQGILAGTATIRQAWGGLVQGMVGALSSGIATMLTKWVAMGAMQLAHYIAVKMGMLAADQAFSAGSVAAYLWAHMKIVAMHAKEAAVAAFKSAMALPFPINVIVAPIAAAGAFVGAMAIGMVSAEQGADLPNRNTVGMLHPREMVLPAPLADVIRGLADQKGNSTTRSTEFSGDMHYHAAPGESFTEAQWISMGKRALRNRPAMAGM